MLVNNTIILLSGVGYGLGQCGFLLELGSRIENDIGMGWGFLNFNFFLIFDFFQMFDIITTTPIHHRVENLVSNIAGGLFLLLNFIYWIFCWEVGMI